MIPSISANASGKSGDSSAGMDTSRNFQMSFQVGGSGAQSQTADLTAAGTGQENNTLLYVALGVLGLVSVLTILRR